MRAPQRIETVDWFRLLWDMVQRGQSFSEVSRRTGIAIMTIYGYRDGSQPPHWRGELLIEMWCAVCDRPRQDIPMTALSLAPRVVHAPAQVQAEAAAVKRLEEAWRA